MSEKVMMDLNFSPLLLISGLLLSGCAHYPVNAPLPAADPRAGYRFQNAAPKPIPMAWRL
jgi:hypothetical protein